MQEIDFKAPFPKGEVKWDTLVGFKTALCSSKGVLQLYNYERPFVAVGETAIWGVSGWRGGGVVGF